MFALDRVQKGFPIDDASIGRLRRAKLVEGRKPNLHVSERIASITNEKAQYIRNRTQDDDHYKKLIMDFIEKFGTASRDDINQLLMKNLSDVLDEDQKLTKVSNLLTAMRRAGQIHNAGSRTQPQWTQPPEKEA